MHFLFCADVFSEKCEYRFIRITVICVISVTEDNSRIRENIPAFFKYMKSVDLSLTSFSSVYLQIPIILA
jgi:hypothetical protein